MDVYVDEWLVSVNCIMAKTGHGGNKLRLYQKFKFDCETETYVNILMPYSHRSALAKFRTGVAPIRLETGRYERLDVNNRICPICNIGIEDEMHVLLKCSTYTEIRQLLLQKARSVNTMFNSYNDIEMLCFLLSDERFVK